jgi:hypothetical protein
MKHTRSLIFLFLILLTACQPAQRPTFELARSTENSVEVIIAITRANDGQVYLTATFTPVENKLHLYSKDVPKNGISGLGRPALLELAKDSGLKANGELIESAPAQNPLSGPQELFIYPAGAVTLSLPVILPEGKNWFNDEVVVTYMACTEYNCRPPVEGKIIPVQIPQNEALN